MPLAAAVQSQPPQCPACNAWNTLQEFVHDPATPSSKGAGSRGGFSGQLSEVQNLNDIVLEETPRISSGMGELDRVLGIGSDGKHGAVVAPNMSKQIVAMQAVVDQAARDFPGAFAGYDLTVIESHQKAKVDTSGTAKAVVASLKELNKASFDVEDVEKVRNDETSLNGANGRLGKVPSEHLPGHAYHTYALTSADGTVTFELRHNVNGRSTYAEGVADACLFLAAKADAGFPRSRFLGRRKRLFDMIDVLQEGAMS